MALSVDIEKTLGDFHLRVKFEAENRVLALLGASGCGKSMTLKCIAGIERPDRGVITLDGTTLFDSGRGVNLPPQRRRVGYLFQQYALFPNMTVEQNIAVGVRDRRRAREETAEAIAAMRLEGLERKRPHQLSGGQQQRAALARILVNRPEVLLLDEPFSALDSHLRFQLEQELRGAIRRFGKTVLLVSHNRDEVFRLSDEVAIMHDGRIETTGEKKAVFANPRTRNGAILTGCKNVSPVEAIGERRARAVDWGVELALPASADGVQYVGIRMHDVRLADAQGEPNAFLCRVEETIENPFSCTVLLRPEGAARPIGWELDKERWRQIRAERLRVCLPPESMLLLKE
ncbi:MAG TPA: ATP-binding cassette domain-containing protein [Candidatus Onthenecus intestinigallinarum]|uniref:ATP-binding cassette domain-containing protein n=1 Tax=Candidatus Onthenecus intestinigallinarum TaxID=2840875 RepID=A0A9D1CR72_9FIRM|nr:ATP-binding cassette domain-containing protein [Candidatus Onthenecus intestinigallinarum]